MCTEKPVKPATTFEEQLDLLKQRNLSIDNEKLALEFLGEVNYYRLSAYLLPFRKLNSECYQEGTLFSTIYRLYEFDRKLRSLILAITEPIEIML